MGAEIGWVPGWVAVSFLVSFLATTICVRWALRPLNRAGEIPWYEQARLAQPARITAGLAFVPAMPLSAMFGGVLGRSFAEGHDFAFALAGMTGAILAVTGVCYRLSRRLLGPRITLRYWLSGLVVFVSLFLGGVLAFGIILFSTPGGFNLRAVLVLVACIVGLLLWMRGGNMRFLELIGLARPATPRLEGIVSEGSAHTGVTPPPAYELRWPMVNAVASPLSGKIAMTDSAMNLLDDGQLRAICVHELAHLKEPRRIVVLRTLAAMMLLPVAAAILLAQTYGLRVFVVAMALYLIVSRWVAAMCRRLECEADAQAAAGRAVDLSYARALETLYRSNLVPLVGYSKGGTHPHGYDRLVAAGLQPDFARPASPPRLRALAGVLMVTALILFTYLTLFVALSIAGLLKSSSDAAG